MIKRLESKLNIKYKELFNKFGIDKETGFLEKSSNFKFPTFPYIGSKYGLSKKILVIGLDIGKNESDGIKSFKERRKDIESKPLYEHNPHIAGTYFTALFFLKDALNLQDSWNKLKNVFSCQKALQKQEELPNINPLSYIALTNYYKFVLINKKNRTGGENRKRLDKKTEFEENFFLDEVKIFNPDIIIFQSNSFKYKKKLLKKLKDMKKVVYIGPHPAYRGKRKPNYFIKKIKKLNF